MKIFQTTIPLIAIILFTKCGPSYTPIEIKGGKHGGIYEVTDSGTEYKFYNNTQTFKLNISTFISFNDFEWAQSANSDEGNYVLNFKLSESGALKLKQLSERNLQKQICLVVDSKIMAAPTIQTAITNGLVTLTIPDKKAFDEIIVYLEK